MSRLTATASEILKFSTAEIDCPFSASARSSDCAWGTVRG